MCEIFIHKRNAPVLIMVYESNLYNICGRICLFKAVKIINNHFLKTLIFLLGMILILPHSPSYASEVIPENTTDSSLPFVPGHFDETGIDDDTDHTFFVTYSMPVFTSHNQVAFLFPDLVLIQIQTPPPDLV